MNEFTVNLSKQKVIDVAEDYGHEISEIQASGILKFLAERFTWQIGISRMVIEVFIDEYFRLLLDDERKEYEKE